MRTFIRARVSLDITKPLPVGFWVPRADLPKIWVIYRYERLQGLCLNCGIIGHEQNQCYNDKVMAAYDFRLPKYDLGIVCPAARSMQAVIKEHRRHRFEKIQSQSNYSRQGSKNPKQESSNDSNETSVNHGGPNRDPL